MSPHFTDFSSQVAPTYKNLSRPSVGDSGLTDLVTKQLGGAQAKASIPDIKWALKRFPELKYNISALATFTSFTNQYPWVGKNVYGPGGISITTTPRLNQDEALIEIVNNAFHAVKEASSLTPASLDRFNELVQESVEPSAMSEQVKSDTLLIKELSQKLLSHNDIYTQLYHAAVSIVTYSACVVDYSEDYSTIFFYSIDDLSMDEEKGIDLQSADKDSSKVWKVKKTGEPLSERAQVITDEDTVDSSPVGRIVHYLKIIDVLETSLSVERLAKSNSFVVWKIGVDGIPGELVTPWLDVYKERVMTRLKAGTDNANIVQASMSKSLTASHIFVPNYKDTPTEVEKVNLEYRPLLDDLEYWWAKVFMALGIPPYYSAISETQNISKDITAFHESLMGSKVRMYQALLEKTLVYWVVQFNSRVLTKAVMDKYTVQVFLPTYVSGGEEGRSEYMRRVNQFASAFSTLSVSGLPITPQFAVKLMFPNSDPQEVVDWQVRKLMNPETTDPYGAAEAPSPVEEEQYVDNVLDAMSRGVNMEDPASAATPAELLGTETDGSEEM